MFWGRFLAIRVLVHVEERKCFKRTGHNIHKNLSLKTTRNIRLLLLENFFDEKSDLWEVFFTFIFIPNNSM